MILFLVYVYVYATMRTFKPPFPTSPNYLVHCTAFINSLQITVNNNIYLCNFQNPVTNFFYFTSHCQSNAEEALIYTVINYPSTSMLHHHTA